MNVPIPELAQRMQLATTVLEATLVSATQDLNPALETFVSTSQKGHVKVGKGVCGGLRSKSVCRKTAAVEEESGGSRLCSKASSAKLKPVISHSFTHSPNTSEHLQYVRRSSRDGGNSGETHRKKYLFSCNLSSSVEGDG